MATAPVNPTTQDQLHEAGVELRVDGARADVVLVRPENRNAQSPATWRALAAVPGLLPDHVRVVVLSAQGPSFSAGLDRRMLDGTGVPGEVSLADIARMTRTERAEAISSYQRGFTWWREVDAVTVAAVQGHAVGAGFQLALACDLMVCAEDAQLAMREPSLGLVPDLAGTRPLVRAVGYSRALEICGTGRWVHAAEAAQLGLAQVVVPADLLGSTVDDLVSALLAAPSGALSATKHLLSAAEATTRAQQLDDEVEAQLGRLDELAGLLR